MELVQALQRRKLQLHHPRTPPRGSLHGRKQDLQGYTLILELQHLLFLPFPAPGGLADGIYFMETTNSPLHWWKPAASAPVCKEVRITNHCREAIAHTVTAWCAAPPQARTKDLASPRRG